MLFDSVLILLSSGWCTRLWTIRRRRRCEAGTSRKLGMFIRVAHQFLISKHIILFFAWSSILELAGRILKSLRARSEITFLSQLRIDLFASEFVLVFIVHPVNRFKAVECTLMELIWYRALLLDD